MSTYEFQGTLFRTQTDMLDALVGEYLSAGGMNDRETMLGLLEADSDQKLAFDCVENWGLDAPRWEFSWMAKREVDWEDIHAAFARLRTNFDMIFPDSDPNCLSEKEEMNLKQIFAKLDSLKEEHGYGRYKVNLDWSVEVLENEDQEEDEE